MKEDQKNILSKYSEVELQLEKQRQRHEEEQQKNFESCQQVKLLSQELTVKDNEYNEMTFALNILVEHGTHLESKCSAAEQQLQEQREKQEQQNVEHLNQVTLLKKDLQDKENCWEAMVGKNNNCVKAIYELHRRLQQLEQRQQQPQHEPRSQLPLAQEKKQKEQFHQRNQRWHHQQQNKSPRVIDHVTSDFELKTSTNAWRPAKKTDLTGRDQDVVRQFRSLLNKITPENFDRLIDKIELINIAKEDHLKDVVQLVLEKAILESKFSEVYANMCHHLAKIEVKETGRPGNILSFRTLLIQSCQNEMKKVIDGTSRLDDDESKDKAPTACRG
uniref:MIF4G domain-containing protein n=2 Tax=Eptatretus burgeri TaxID=7764 RepID=A0A8C4WPM8_EPTBU